MQKKLIPRSLLFCPFTFFAPISQWRHFCLLSATRKYWLNNTYCKSLLWQQQGKLFNFWTEWIVYNSFRNTHRKSRKLLCFSAFFGLYALVWDTLCNCLRNGEIGKFPKDDFLIPKISTQDVPEPKILDLVNLEFFKKTRIFWWKSIGHFYPFLPRNVLCAKPVLKFKFLVGQTPGFE